EIRRQYVVTIELTRGERCVTLVEPPRRQIAQRLVEREMRELVTEHIARITRVAPGGASLHHDAMRLRKGDRGTPFRRARTDPRAKARMVWRDRDEHAFLGP